MIYVILGLFIITTLILGGLIVGLGSSSVFQSAPYQRVIMPPAPSITPVQVTLLSPEPPLAVPFRRPPVVLDMVVSNTFTTTLVPEYPNINTTYTALTSAIGTYFFSGNISFNGTYMTILSRTNTVGPSTFTVTQTTYTFNPSTRQYNTGSVTYTAAESVTSGTTDSAINARALYFADNELLYFHRKQSGQTIFRWRTIDRPPEFIVPPLTLPFQLTGTFSSIFCRDVLQTSKRLYVTHFPVLNFARDIWGVYGSGGVTYEFNTYFYMRDACGYRSIGETNESVPATGQVAKWAVANLYLWDLHTTFPANPPLSWTFRWKPTGVYFYDNNIQQALFMKDGSVLHMLYTTGVLKLHLLKGDQIDRTIQVFTDVTEFYCSGDLLVTRSGQTVTVRYMDYEPYTLEYEYTLLCTYTLTLSAPTTDRVLDRNYNARYNNSSNELYVFQPINNAQISFQCLHFRPTA